MTGAPGSPFRRVGLVGFGLMGGSLARALKALPSPPHVTAFSLDPEDLRMGLQAGVLDLGTEHPEELLPDRDMVVYAVPLGATLKLLGEHRSLWGPDTVVTDLVSLKAPIQARMEALGEAHRHVGCHPMAGGERRGFHASRGGLFQGVRIWMTATRASEETRVSLEAFWEALGAHPRWTEAQAHDRLMAWVSHLPQLTANALALALEGEGIQREQLGPGGRDMTRLAGSAPEMWKDLLTGMGSELPEALRSLEAALARFRIDLEEGRIEEVAERMNRTRGWSWEDPWS